MTRVVRSFRRAAVPLTMYYAVTLALPAANGAARGTAFAEHAAVVLAVPVVIILLASAAGWSLRLLRRFALHRVG